MDNFIASLSLITDGALLMYFFKGLLFTLIIAAISIVVGFVIGAILALARNYCTKGFAKVFKGISVGYIEVFRNTPLMLWLFICLVFLPAPHVSVSFASFLGLSSVDVQTLFRATVALILFTSSVMAEIIRGGLNSVDKGQFEAGYSQGFTFVGVMINIAFPQAFKAIIPTMLSQVITTIKDTSYVANIATIELLARVFQMIQLAPNYTGQSTQNVSDVFVLCGFACIIYFVINFSISILVRKTQKKTQQSFA